MYEIISAYVFITTTGRVAFTKTKNLVYAVRCSLLYHNNFTCFWTNLPLISRIKQFSIPPVAWTALCVPAAVRASTENCSFYPALVLFDIFVVRYIL